MATRPLSTHYLPFEQPLKAYDERICKLEDLSKQNNMDLSADIAVQVAEREKFLRETFSKLSAWDRVQVARHVHRPQTADYIELMCEDFIELHGDRAFGDDRAMLTGLAQMDGQKFLLVGQHKGRDVQERSACNFGSPQPEGYRKALLKMRLAEKMQLPIVALIDTKGAAPDVGAEERGQSQAIAYNLMIMSGLKVPIVCIVIGEGGSGGALGIGVGDRLLIQEFAYFSVISPEGCASILWKDAERKADAAEALKITAPELIRLGVMDGFVPEPLGGAHRNPAAAARILRSTILQNLRDLQAMPLSQLLEQRYRKLRAMGKYRDEVLQSVNAAAVAS
ncbi:MAG TPA: acetyl-CoA carboxylase carboxyltransferase subunit alpha [Planctomycetota bacterium]|nr:acetyl-CoA carboxylase carboxyltransferase subunit alpha [Planctomycetota bacterium]